MEACLLPGPLSWELVGNIMEVAGCSLGKMQMEHGQKVGNVRGVNRWVDDDFNRTDEEAGYSMRGGSTSRECRSRDDEASILLCLRLGRIAGTRTFDGFENKFGNKGARYLSLDRWRSHRFGRGWHLFPGSICHLRHFAVSLAKILARTAHPEKFSHDVRTFLDQHPFSHRHIGVEGMGWRFRFSGPVPVAIAPWKDLKPTSISTQQRILCSIHYSCDPGLQYSSCAHNARFQGNVQGHTQEPPCLPFSHGRLSKAQDFCMGSRIAFRLHPIVRACDDVSFCIYCHCSHRHFSTSKGQPRFFQGQAHVVFVLGALFLPVHVRAFPCFCASSFVLSMERKSMAGAMCWRTRRFRPTSGASKGPRACGSWVRTTCGGGWREPLQMVQDPPSSSSRGALGQNSTRRCCEAQHGPSHGLRRPSRCVRSSVPSPIHRKGPVQSKGPVYGTIDRTGIQRFAPSDRTRIPSRGERAHRL